MTINILTLFPDFFTSQLESSILKRAQTKKLIKFNIINIRDFAKDKHKTTDDRPFGGGAGMVMKIEPINLALESLKNPGKILLTSAKGKLFNQNKAKQLAKLNNLTLICGHYEGVDERVNELLVDEEIRIGDYVLTGGEPAVGVIIDAISRLVPGVLGNKESLSDESHSDKIKFSHPVYTKPRDFKGHKVPTILLTGDHQKILKWQKEQQENI